MNKKKVYEEGAKESIEKNLFERKIIESDEKRDHARANLTEQIRRGKVKAQGVAI